MPRKVGKLGRDGTRRFGAGAEIDLVLEMPGGKRWAVEVKRGLAPKLDKGFHRARQDLDPALAPEVDQTRVYAYIRDGA